MSKKKSVAGVARSARAEDKAFRTTQSKNLTKDSFVNFSAALGLGANNQLSRGTYVFNYLTRNRTTLEAMYRGNWLIRRAVDCGAEDMTRAGIEFEGTIPPDDIGALSAQMLDMQVWQRLCDCARWARLFGGCIAVMLIDGQDAKKPLRVDAIAEGSFRGLLILDRWMVQPDLTDLITELGPDLGMPKFYQVNATAPALSMSKIHHSRVLRMDGLPLPYYQQLVEMGWGESIIENIHDRVVAYDSISMGAAQLAFKAHLRTLKIPQLRELVATGGPAYQGLVATIEFMRQMQSNEGLTLIDGEDEFDTYSYTFAGLSDIQLQAAQQISGAIEIPLVRLLGQSPAGLNSTGESDLRTYYDGVGRQQEQKLRRPVTRLVDVMAASAGIELPDDFQFKFRPLWMLTETEKAEIANKDGLTITGVADAGLIGPQTALKELRQSARVTGRFSNITDEEIAAADVEPPKAEEVTGEEGKEDDSKTDADTKP